MASWICRSCRAVLTRSISWKTHLPSSQLPHYSTDRYGSSLHSKEAQQALVHHTYGKLMDVARRSMQEEPRERFAEALQSYMKQEKYRRRHVKFITFALHQLSWGVWTSGRFPDLQPTHWYLSQRQVQAKQHLWCFLAQAAPSDWGDVTDTYKDGGECGDTRPDGAQTALWDIWTCQLSDAEVLPDGVLVQQVCGRWPILDSWSLMK